MRCESTREEQQRQVWRLHLLGIERTRHWSLDYKHRELRGKREDHQFSSSNERMLVRRGAGNIPRYQKSGYVMLRRDHGLFGELDQGAGAYLG